MKDDFWKMKKTIVSILLLVLSLNIFAQGDFESLMKQGQQATKDGKYLLSVLKYKKASELQPLNENPIIQVSWNYLLLKNFDEAKKYAVKAFYLNQSNLSCHSMVGYVMMSQGESGGEKYLQEGIALSPPEYKEYFLADFQDLREAGIAPDVFTSEAIDNYFSQKENWHLDANWLFESISRFYAGEINMGQIISRLKTSPIPIVFKTYYIKLFSGALANSGYNDDVKSLVLVGKSIQTPDAVTEKYIQTSLIANLMRVSNYAGDFEQTTKYFKEIDDQNWERLDYMNLSHPLAECWLLASQAYNSVGEINAQENVGKQLIAVSGTYQDPWYHANGYNSLGIAKLNSTLSSDRSAALSHLQTALKMAQSNGFQSLIPSIAANLALSYWQHGKQEEAKRAYIKLSKDAIAMKDFLSAELYLNNLASLYFFNKDYRNAAIHFQESINIIEQYRSKIPNESKMTFLQARQSSYTFLTSCLVKLGDRKALFRTQEDQRARVLADQLKRTESPQQLTLAQFQRTLSPDQAAIYYTLMEAGVVVIHVVTANESYAIQHEAFDAFIAFKNKYLSRIKSSYKSREGFKPALANRMEGGIQIIENNKARLINGEDFEMIIQFSRELLQKENEAYDAIRKDFLSMLYKFLIAPVESRIGSKTKLLISPDGLLNFVPFEVLTNGAGNYLAQTHELSYIQSGSVYQSLLTRNYSDNRKGMLAFGGALYEKMNVEAKPMRSIQRMNEVKLNVEQKLISGQSMREEYAAIGFGKMNYLPGTLAEVNSLSGIVPNSTVYRGAEFDESFIKKLSNSGEMSQYQVVHFATHGFSLPAVPALSGIATSIFPNEKNGEDGYLTVNELAKLNLKADFAVLSACETGLGKIYGGEGVFGLTQALLVAGANEVAVSLWPVSDQGTMYFMTGMYDLVVKGKFSYSEAMTEMKRQFIAGKFGEQFKHPVYWAPFVHYGKTNAAVNSTATQAATINAANRIDNTTTLALHRESVYRMAISPDSQLAATGDDEGRVLVWDINTLQPTTEFTFQDNLKGLHFNETGTAAYTYSSYNELIKHDLSTGQASIVLPKGAGDVTYTRDWKKGIEIVAVKNHLIEFIDLETGELVSSMNLGESGYVADLIPLPDQDRFILSFITWGHKDDRVMVYELSSKKLLQTIKTEAVNIYYSPEENAVLAIQARGNYAVKKIDLATGEINVLNVDRGNTLVMTGGGKFMTNKYLHLNNEGIHFIHGIESGNKLSQVELKGFEFPKKSLSEGKVLMMDSSGLLRVFDVQTGKLIK